MGILKSLLIFGTLSCVIIRIQADNKMQIFGKLINDDGETKTITLEVEPSTKIKDIRGKMAKQIGIPIESLVLIFNNQELQDARTVDYYNIKNGSTLNLEEM
uniref:Ubiquitin-like n=1 Tax=Diabrotica virgifera virgifera TaxID=50390 RepID=A0A6P7GRG1_DIAVI